MGGGDFSSGFSFDLGAAKQTPQAPWEFSGALAAARQEQAGSISTTIDHKIQQRLLTKKYAGGGGGGKENGGSGKGSDDDDDEEEEEDVEPGVSSAEEEGSDDEDSEEEEEALLPGEEDLSGDDGEGVEPEDEDSGEDEDEAMSSDKDEPLPGEVDSSDEEEPEEMEAGGNSDDDDDDDDDDDEEEEGEGGQLASRQKTSGFAESRTKAGRSARSPFFSKVPEGTSFSSGSFADLNLSRPLVKACEALGYSQPTPIQAACIPVALAGRDICGSAMTGSGKTAAFGLPLLERLMHRQRRISATYVVILTPTRELAVQVHSMLEKLAQFTDIRAALVVGGLSLNVQAATLRSAPEIVVATPGRLLDHLRNSQSVHLEDLATLVLDEADRLLEMGFAEEVQEVVRTAPTKRQTLLFSATMTDEVKKLATMSLRKPVRLAADVVGFAPKQLRQEIVRLKGGQAQSKEAVLLSICSRSFSRGHTIVFAKTKQQAHRLKILFGLAQLPLAVELHGNMTQAARLQSLEEFRQGRAAFLIATDVAARGLDILGVEAVVNYDCPRAIASYVHRIGRTARAGAKGVAVTLVEDADRKLLKDVVKTTRAQLQSRAIPDGVVAKWQARVEGLQGDYHRIIQEERVEKELRKAEMEAEKAANFIEHESEIMSRPKRTWFQTERQKRALAEAVKLGMLGGSEKDNGKPKNAKDRKKLKLKEKRAEAKEAKVEAKKKAVEDEFNSTKKMVRAAKSRATKFRESGVASALAGKMAAAAVDQTKKRKPKTELFSGDGTKRRATGRMVGAADDSLGAANRGPRVYSGGGKSKAVKAPKDSLTTKEKKNITNKGKGRHAFKSKARHNRKR